MSFDRNPEVYLGPYSWVNNPWVIAKNDRMVSVNTAMSIDLYGQVCADNLGGRQQSACGGQVDYVRGAQMSKGGKSFIALTSVLCNKDRKISRIQASFPAGKAVCILIDPKPFPAICQEQKDQFALLDERLVVTAYA